MTIFFINIKRKVTSLKCYICIYSFSFPLAPAVCTSNPLLTSNNYFWLQTHNKVKLLNYRKTLTCPLGVCLSNCGNCKALVLLLQLRSRFCKCITVYIYRYTINNIQYTIFNIGDYN